MMYLGTNQPIKKRQVEASERGVGRGRRSQWGRETRTDNMVLYWSALSCRVRIALSLNKKGASLAPSFHFREIGVLSDVRSIIAYYF